MEKFIFAVYVDNKPGVLTRVTSMFTRRGFNIDTLTVGETERPEYSRITISLSGDGYARDQMLNQLRKLHNVKRVVVLKDDSLRRELALVKIKNSPDRLSEIVAASNIYRAKVVDYTPDAMCIEVTGDSSKIDAFLKILAPMGIIESCRTGVVALDRGESALMEDK